MPFAHRMSEAIFILLMAAGAMLALYAFNAAIENYLDDAARYGTRVWDVGGTRVLVLGGTAIAEFLATIAFAIVYARRGSNLFAPVAYLWSYAGLGAVFALTLAWASRHAEPSDGLWIVPGLLFGAVVIAAPGLLWNHRVSSRG